MGWYRKDKEAVAEALRRGERPDLATTMASGPLDELVAFHEELGSFAILDELSVRRARAGVPDELLLRAAFDLAVGAWQGLRCGGPRVGRRLPSGGLGVCVSSPSDHRGLATLERACLGERQRSRGDPLADRASVGGGRAQGNQLAARRRDVCRWA